MNRIILNIGCNVGDKPAFTPEFALLHLKRKFTVLEHVSVKSDTEETLVAIVPGHPGADWEGDSVEADIFALAHTLGQQAIAWAYEDAIATTGTLTGPDAASWGSFDRSRFITYDEALLKKLEAPVWGGPRPGFRLLAGDELVLRGDLLVYPDYAGAQTEETVGYDGSFGLGKTVTKATETWLAYYPDDAGKVHFYRKEA